MSCRAFRDSVFSFLGDDLPEDRRADLQAHLDACPACAAYLEVERSFERGLRARLERAPAPPGLETRIRAALASGSAGARPRWWTSPLLATAATVVLVAGLAVPALRSGAIAPVGRGAAAHEVVRAATVVDEHCDPAGASIEAQRHCKNPTHLNVLKLADGTYLHISLDDPAHRALVFDAAERGRRVVVRGRLYPAIDTIRIERIEDDPGRSAKL